MAEQVRLAEKIEVSFAAQAKMAERLNETINQVGTLKPTKDLSDMDEVLRRVNKSLAQTGVEAGGFGGALGRVSRVIKGDFVRQVTFAVVAVEGLQQGFANMISLTKGAVGLLSSVAGAMFNIGASIIAIPLKIFTGLVDLAASADMNFSELRQAVENLRKSFGDLYDATSKTVITASKHLTNFKDTGLSTWRVFGLLHERLNLVREVAETMGATFDSTRQEWIDNGGALLGFQKGLGFTNEQMKVTAQQSIATGVSMSKFLLDVTKQTTGLSEAFDISQKVIGKDMARAFEDMRHFATRSVAEIGKASVFARKLGLELDKIVGTLDAFETFDTAAENAAKLTQTFGVTIDAFKLMEAQSPAEQIDQLRSAFSRAGVDVNTFNRQQLKLLSQTTGLDEMTVKQALSLKNQGVSLDEVGKKSAVAAAKQMTQTEAMQKLAASIERLVKDTPAQVGSFFDMFVRGVFRGLQSSKEFFGTIMNIKLALNQVHLVGVELGRMLPAIVPGLGQFLGGLKEFFQPEKFRTLAEGIKEAVKRYFKSGDLKGSLSGIQDAFMSFFTVQSPVAMKIYDGFKKIFAMVVQLVNQSIPIIANALTKGLNTITDFIRDPSKLASGGKGALKGMGFLGEAMSSVFDSLKKAGPAVGQALFELLSVAWNKATDLVWNYVKANPGTVMKIIGAYAAIMAAPAAASTLAFGLTKMIGIAAANALGAGAASSALRGKAAMFLADMFGGGNSAVAKTIRDTVTTALANAGTAAGNTMSKSAASGLSSAAEAASGKIGQGIAGSAATGGAEFAKKASGGILGAVGSAVGSIGKAIGGMIASAGAMATAFATKLGFSSAGSMLGATAGLAAAAYIGVKGKQMIDEAFAKSQAQQKEGASAVAGGINALGTRSIDEKQKAVERLQASLKEQEKQLDTNMFERALNSLGGVDPTAAARVGIETTKRSITDLEKQIEKLQQTGSAPVPGANEATGAFNFFGASTVEDASAKLAELDKISKKLNGKDYDVKKTIDEVREKLKTVNFSLIDETQIKTIGSSTQAFAQIGSGMQNLQAVMSDMSSFVKDLGEFTKVMKSEAISNALDAVKKMANAINDLDSALADGELAKIDVKTKLRRVAINAGLGSKGSYTIQTKPANITVNLQVTMSADELEKSMVMRAKSIIRDRLNYATNNPNSKGIDVIPDKPGDVQFPLGSLPND